MTHGLSGKKIVPLLYGAAVLLCGWLLWQGLEWSRTRTVSPPLPAKDRALLLDLPRDWARITFIEGQGWVRFAACHSDLGSLVITSDLESPRLLCEWCDSIQEATVRRVSRQGKPVKVRLRLGSMGTAWVEPVDEGVAARFMGAPVRDYVLTWTLNDGTEMVFVPAETAREFETLRAADESPEGCLEVMSDE
jgi:hypothetical protein